MKNTSIPVALAILASTIIVAAQGDRTGPMRFRVTEEVHVNGALHDARSEIFIPATELTNFAQVRIESADGAAFLNLTDLRVKDSNLWFRKWEYGRIPPQEGTSSPFYMIRSGSVGFETSPEHHLVIGDTEGLRESHKRILKDDGTTIRTCIILRAEKTDQQSGPADP